MFKCSKRFSKFVGIVLKVPVIYCYYGYLFVPLIFQLTLNPVVSWCLLVCNFHGGFILGSQQVFPLPVFIQFLLIHSSYKIAIQLFCCLFPPFVAILHLFAQFSSGPAVRVFANGPGDLGSIPGRVIPKTLKMELDTTLLNTQHYKVRFKGKVEQSWEWSSALPYTLV